jgi:hypothetical protein
MFPLLIAYLVFLPDAGTAAAKRPSTAEVGAQQKVSDDEARQFVEKWLATQNEGRFADYSRLYAPQFHGVRRSGDRTVELDRDGWLADRARMFKKSMKVQASQLQVRPVDARSSQVSFAQEFASGGYHDRGPKLMRLRRAEGGLLIESEEMLSSETLRRDLPAVNFPLVANGCPGEYCDCVASDRLKAAVELHELPDVDSKILLRLKAGTRVDNVAFKQVISRAGIARRKDGSRVYYLGPGGEGVCVIHDGESFAQTDCDDLVVEDDRTVMNTWVEITYKGKVGYAPDGQAVPHGQPDPGGKCVFGGF